MKSVIVFYLPDNVSDEELEKFRKGSINVREGFEIFVVIDPSRTKVETEVFFKPEII